jgi:hypothetical protein
MCGNVLPGRVTLVLGCVQAVRVRQMRVMRSLFVIAGLVVIGGRVVVARGVLVMLRGFPVMVGCFL